MATFEFWIDEGEEFSDEDLLHPSEIIDAGTLHTAAEIAVERMECGIDGSEVTLISHCIDDDAWTEVELRLSWSFVSAKPTTRKIVTGDY